MKITLLKPQKLFSLILPQKVSGNYWLQDEDDHGKFRNLINIDSENEIWTLNSNEDVQIIYNNTVIPYANLKDGEQYVLKVKGERNYSILMCEPVCEDTYQNFEIMGDCTIGIGSGEDNQITYACPNIAKKQATLTFQGGTWTAKCENSSFPVYVNNQVITLKKLENNDLIFIWGLRITVVGKIIVINNPKHRVTFHSNLFEPLTILLSNTENVEERTSTVDYFVRPPRFRTTIENKLIKIDSPPAKAAEDDKPYFLVIGPMLTMAMMSVVTIFTAVNGLTSKQQTVSQVMPSMVMGVAMLATMLIWPLITKKFEKKQREKRERKRQQKYKEYLDKKKEEIILEMGKQKQIMIENHLSLKDCQSIILNKQRNLWERKIYHDDFLELRLGIGNVTPKIKLEYTEESFALEEDNLKNQLYSVVSEGAEVKNTPVTISLTEKYITAVVGNHIVASSFVNGLLLQMLTFHGYDDVKLVILTSETKKSRWETYKVCPHIWNDEKTFRFYAVNVDEINQVSSYLSQIFEERYNQSKTERKSGVEKKDTEYKKNLPYFVIVTDDYENTKKVTIIKQLLGAGINVGFSLLIQNDRLVSLPNECECFISIDTKQSGLFENELVSNKQKIFQADFIENIAMERCFSKLSNIPIEIAASRKALPDKIGFLEMYKVGKISQLNILNRWKMNNPIISLQAAIGIDTNGDLFKLDLHEKNHGPHGLVAGMTGSGKSEFIISYVLSMAINYHPDEVSFVLIDYKGGGLAGAFENRETGLRLPHLAGTITNLDENEMNRSLVSIQSELKRRQRLFNKERDALKEGTIDIYKYQRFYREGKVKEPVPHLFIICDEFAELKVQQPDFMAQLISAARIGRSLGVHLILATQKPAGVVDDQIWSNSRFRVCLKVQEKADSMDMIKCDSAASIKQIGQFYLQVGYNELFALGQSAYAGSPYLPTDNIEKSVDKSIYFINNIGDVVKQIDDNKEKKELKIVGEQLPNIVQYLSQLSKEENLSSKRLWLEKIPANIYLEDIQMKYKYQKNSIHLYPVIGEYDVPNNQKQALLTLPLSKDGNIIIYGMAGSGKENLLSTIIYSCITNYTVDEVNFYLLDFGSETLKSYLDAPQIGDFVTLNETEKIDNLFKMLLEEMNKRKEIFADYNGSYEFYRQSTNKEIPRIVVIMNNYEAFLETYENKEEYETAMMQLTREGYKYGIIFILTVSSTSGSVRFRMLQNFPVKIPLQLSDKTDYAMILNSSRKLFPSKLFGRGLIALDDVYEFQTAQICPKDKELEQIRYACTVLKNTSDKKAPKIPVLPSILRFNAFDKKVTLKEFPVGLRVDGLEPCYYNFDLQFGHLICSEEIENMKPFIEELIIGIQKISNTIVHVIDAASLLDRDDIINENFESEFKEYNESLSNNYDKGLLTGKRVIEIFIGFHNYTESLGNSKETYYKYLIDIKKAKFATCLFIDTGLAMQKHAYESWFIEATDSSTGIWIGDGYDNQNAIKNQVYSRNLSELIGNKFGYVIKKGRPMLIKTIEVSSIGESDPNEQSLN